MGWDDSYAVRAAVVSDRGYFTAEDLARLDRDQWLALRNSLSNDRKGGDNELRGVCAWCGHPVYVHFPKKEGRPPYFQHHVAAPLDCPWYEGRARSTEQRRAEKFLGARESDFHRLMCELILELASKDRRYIQGSGAVNRYLRPENSIHGRYPDASFEWDNRRYAIEFQLASSMQPEIAGREIFYDREGVTLIWVFGRFEPEEITKAGFADIVHRQRGNIFILDREAIRMSHERETLCLTVNLANGSSGYDSQTVPIDLLKQPVRGLAYLEDRTIAPFLETVEGTRQAISNRLLLGKGSVHPPAVPEIQVQDEWRAHRLAAVSFSCWSAANGGFVNYLNGQPNLKALLDSYLNSVSDRNCAELLQPWLKVTQAATLVSDHIRKKVATCIAENPQIDSKSEEARFLAATFPEVFDPVWRERLKRACALPSWAASSRG